MPASITLPGGTRKEYTYDPLMRMKSITAKDPGQNQFMNYNYQYAPAEKGGKGSGLTIDIWGRGAGRIPDEPE